MDKFSIGLLLLAVAVSIMVLSRLYFERVAAKARYTIEERSAKEAYHVYNRLPEQKVLVSREMLEEAIDDMEVDKWFQHTVCLAHFKEALGKVPLLSMSMFACTSDYKQAVEQQILDQLPEQEYPNDKNNVPKWIVNDLGELGVKVGGRCFFLYKGDNLEYSPLRSIPNNPILYRSVGKYEFGETQWPAKWIKAGKREDRYTQELVHEEGLSEGKPNNPEYKWRPLPKQRVQLNYFSQEKSTRETVYGDISGQV